MVDKNLIIRIPIPEPYAVKSNHLTDILLCDQEELLPFKLPELVEWPQGARASAQRAQLLMKAGLKYLQTAQSNQVAPHTEPLAVSASNQRDSVAPDSTKLAGSKQENTAQGNLQEAAPEAPQEIKQDVPSVVNRPPKKAPDFDISLFQ